VNVLPALLGSKGNKGREQLVLQNNGEAPLALRVGTWKLVQAKKGAYELYDLAQDLEEKVDLASTQTERLAQMKEALAAEMAKGR
jgi:arylsulfatase A-like enzyme